MGWGHSYYVVRHSHLLSPQIITPSNHPMYKASVALSLDANEVIDRIKSRCELKLLIQKDDFFKRIVLGGHEPLPLPPLYVHRRPQIRYFNC